MACVADRIIASPFAVLGSIGVITDIPNVYERLKKEGIEFQTVTAGKYKRTVTPTKKVTKEDLDKTKADVEDILVLFRDFVKTNRPKLDIDKVRGSLVIFRTSISPSFILFRLLQERLGSAQMRWSAIFVTKSRQWIKLCWTTFRTILTSTRSITNLPWRKRHWGSFCLLPK